VSTGNRPSVDASVKAGKSSSEIGVASLRGE
jgi:hypothetical protein